jgi:hypothetical protein
MLEEMNELMKLAQACDQRGACSSHGNYENKMKEEDEYTILILFSFMWFYMEVLGMLFP